MIDKKQIPREVLEILDQLSSQGYPSYLVGGALRDLLLGKVPKDYDICTAATPEQVKGIFTKVIDTGLKFGTVTVIKGTFSVEVTTFRSKNGSYGTTAGDDVKARDFTINGLLFDGDKLIDLVGGSNDLADQRIQAIGAPDARYREDALRMLRAVRLHCQLGFLIEENTYNAIRQNAGLIQGVAPERIRDELSKIMISKQPSKGIIILHDTGLLKLILPELDQCYDFDQKNIHHDKNVFDHIMAVIDHTSHDLILRLAALCHDIAKPLTFSLDDRGVGHFYRHDLKGQELSRAILSRLKFDHKTIETVGILVREHMHRIKVMRHSTLRRQLNRVGRENIFRLIELQQADDKASAPPHHDKLFGELKKAITKIIERDEPLLISDLAINGNDLLELGFIPGPEIGRTLHLLLNKVLNNPKMNKKEILISAAIGMAEISRNQEADHEE